MALEPRQNIAMATRTKQMKYVVNWKFDASNNRQYLDRYKGYIKTINTIRSAL